MTESLFKEWDPWLKYIPQSLIHTFRWVKLWDIGLKLNNHHITLTLDNFSSHSIQYELKCITLIYFWSSLTSHILPLDAASKPITNMSSAFMLFSEMMLKRQTYTKSISLRPWWWQREHGSMSVQLPSRTAGIILGYRGHHSLQSLWGIPTTILRMSSSTWLLGWKIRGAFLASHALLKNFWIQRSKRLERIPIHLKVEMMRL